MTRRFESGITRAWRGLLLAAGALSVAGVLSAAEPGNLGVDAYLIMGEPEGVPLTGAALDRQTEELGSLMRCPVCQGLSIAASPVDLAVDMKTEVRELLAAGYSDEQILDYFETSYGEFIRLEPKRQGFNLTVWIAPMAALAAGLWLIVWRMRRSGPARAEPPGEDLSAYLEKVRREVGS